MSTQTKIYCYKCHNEYYIYHAGIDRDKPGFCPHCGAKMDDQMWNDVISAILTVHDVNCHFHKYYMERNEPRFSISIENVEVCTTSD